jgi:hypothetical protein
MTKHALVIFATLSACGGSAQPPVGESIAKTMQMESKQQKIQEDAKAHDRYAFARTLDSTERIATVVARYASYRRSYETVNAYYHTLDSVEAADIRAAARRHFTDAGLMVTTLSREPLPAGIAKMPGLDSSRRRVRHARPAVAPAVRPAGVWRRRPPHRSEVELPSST